MKKINKNPKSDHLKKLKCLGFFLRWQVCTETKGSTSTKIITGGLHTAKLIWLSAANVLDKFRGLHAAEIWSGSLRNLQIYTLDLHLGNTSMSKRKTEFISS